MNAKEAVRGQDLLIMTQWVSSDMLSPGFQDHPTDQLRTMKHKIHASKGETILVVEDESVIRAALRGAVEARAAEIAAGTAPNNLATRIMTTPNPGAGRDFKPKKILNQITIFFLTRHKTSTNSLT